MPKLKPKAKASSSSSKAVASKPWAEQSVLERYGTQPKVVNLAKQLKDVLRYLEAQQEHGCISWAEIITQGIPHWWVRAVAMVLV